MNATQYMFWIYATFVPMLDNDSFFVRDYATHILNENRSPLIFLAKPVELEGKIRLRQLQDNTRCQIAQQWFDQNKTVMPWCKPGHASMRYLYSPLNNAKDYPAENRWDRWRLSTALYLRDYISDTLDLNGVKEIVRELQTEENRWVELHKVATPPRLQPNDH